MNTPISRTSLSVSECASRRTSRRRLRHGRFAPPSVAEGQEVFDFGEVRINGAELVANSLDGRADIGSVSIRSEEHTSELQSLMRISYAVFCLKKKTTTLTTRHKIKHCITDATATV